MLPLRSPMDKGSFPPTIAPRPGFDPPPAAEPRFESGVHREPQRELLPPLDPLPAYEAPVRPTAPAPMPEPASFENVFSSFELTPDAAPAEPVLAPVQPPRSEPAPARPADPFGATPPFGTAPSPVFEPVPAAAPSYGTPSSSYSAPSYSAPSFSPPPASPPPFRDVTTTPAAPPRAEALAAPAAAPKPKPKASGLDALAELEKLRKEAFTSKPAAAKAAAPAEARNGKHEIIRELRLLMSRNNFNRARRFSLTVQLEDAEHRPVDVARHLHVDIDDVSSLEQLLLRLDIALQSSA